MVGRLYRAQFDQQDEAVVVRAAFACPLCLCTADLAVVDDTDAGGIATTCCTACRESFLVALRPDQLVRLWTRPPAGVFIHHRLEER